MSKQYDNTDKIEDGSWLCDECIEAEIERHHEQEEAD